MAKLLSLRDIAKELHEPFHRVRYAVAEGSAWCGVRAGYNVRRQYLGNKAAPPTYSRFKARTLMGSVIKKRRKRMAKKKHRKLLKKTRVQRRNKK